MTERDIPEREQPVNLHEAKALANIQVRPGVTLRPLEISDAARMLEILDADDSIRDKVGVAAHMHTIQDVGAQIESYKKDPHLVRYAILENDNPIGLVSFWRDVDDPFDGPDRPNDYGFGYFLDPAQRGKGIVSDTVNQLMNVASMNLRVDQFIAYCELDNAQSISVLTKLGFEPTEAMLVEHGSGRMGRKYVRSPSLPD